MANDVESLFSTTNRDFLISNNDHEVKIESLKGKKVGIYFSSSWCGPCRKFTPFLVEVYNELAPKGDFEVIFVSADEDDESFKAYFSKMPWLAIPFSDSDTRNHLDELFDVKGIPHLVLLDETGKIVTDCGTEVIREFGVEGYPFSSERIQELNDQEEEDKKNQTLTSILTSPSRNFVISSHGKKILVSDLEGKTIGLYFSLTPDKAYDDFTPRLVEVYEKLKAVEEEFEVVTIPLDDDDDDDDDDDEEEESLKAELQSLPWLSLPLKDQSCEKLARYFELSAIPTLVIIGPNGRTLHSNVVEFIEEHGIDAYPFTPEKFDELIGIQKAEDASQTLESILVSGDEDLSLEKMEKGKGSKDDAKEEKKSKDEWVCDGEVCFKA
ncbi:PREDICTED: probable nucleoredoxin 1 [Lupinus angustifolius]|uniref:probable nucleoredoxin 1 n=1 Tax=Lupinus angustifolius TaxID=3871 RepID=UPI00092F7B91|nr:PREDICTED: probable nucleoredoxin 1 [Lupinus angustifolius]